MSLADFLQLPEWHTDAECRHHDPDHWFPARGESNKYAIAVCKTCPVQQECLAWAVKHHPITGVWGGYSERARRAMKAPADPDAAKECRRCRTVKPVAAFPRNGIAQDGRLPYCFECRTRMARQAGNVSGWRGPTAKQPKVLP